PDARSGLEQVRDARVARRDGDRDLTDAHELRDDGRVDRVADDAAHGERLVVDLDAERGRGHGQIPHSYSGVSSTLTKPPVPSVSTVSSPFSPGSTWAKPKESWSGVLSPVPLTIAFCSVGRVAMTSTSPDDSGNGTLTVWPSTPSSHGVIGPV